MIRIVLMVGVSTASLAIPALLLAEGQKLEEEAAKEQNKHEAVREFGSHERPWAADALTPEYRSGEDEQDILKRGLRQSQKTIEEMLDQQDLALPAARVSSMAAVTEVLATISAERGRLRDEFKRLEDQRAEVALANRRALEEIAHLEDLRAEVTSLIDELAIEQNENLEQVVSVIGNMTAKNAARMLERNEPKFIVEVLDQIGERNAADILSRMQTEQATEVVSLMAERGRPNEQTAF